MATSVDLDHLEEIIANHERIYVNNQEFSFSRELVKNCALIAKNTIESGLFDQKIVAKKLYEGYKEIVQTFFNNTASSNIDELANSYKNFIYVDFDHLTESEQHKFLYLAVVLLFTYETYKDPEVRENIKKR